MKESQENSEGQPPGRSGREMIPIGDRLGNRLSAYALAAGAGAGLLAAAPSARADITYTSANINLGGNQSTYIALGDVHDALWLINFAIETSCSWCIGRGSLEGEGPRAVAATYGQALKAGLNGGPLPKESQIGPSDSSPNSVGLNFSWYSRRVPSSLKNRFTSIGSWGAWAGHPGHLGVKFDIDNQIHYGWVAAGGSGASLDVSGWAYDTIPDEPIDAGQTSAPPGPAILGVLALGSLGLGCWRRKLRGRRSGN